MRNSNISQGSQFEREFCETLGKYGWWVHRMTQSAAGQPADVIAVKDGKASLIDCKLCTGRYFDTARIEDNQRSSMRLWAQCGNGSGWFAVKINGNVYMASLRTLDGATKRMLNEKWFVSYAYPFEWWVMTGCM